MLLYEVSASEVDAHIMKCSRTKTKPALCCAIQTMEPQASAGVSSPDLCLLPIWEHKLHFDLILCIYM